MKAVIALIAALALAVPASLDAGSPPRPAESVKLTPIGRFSAPTHVTAPPADSRRLFVVEKAGAIRVLVDGRARSEPFLDLRGEVRSGGGEQGLLSLAFAPDYASSGRLYVYFVDEDENARLVEFRRSRSDPSRADPSTRREVMRIEQPSGEHYGGLLLFGPDGYLYLGIGDGGLERNRDPMRAQRLDDLHGKILRIDPRGDRPGAYSVPATNPFVGEDGARPEIWAKGLRNPWRFWIDRITGDLYVGDVGEYVRESVEYVRGGRAAGRNFGWPCFEGGLPSAVYGPELCPGAVPVLLEYAREGTSCSVIGGLVVRDPRLPALAGRYLYSDFCGGELHVLRVRDGRIVARARLDVGRIPSVTSFGEDARGRVFVTSLTGRVYRLDPRLRPSPAGAARERGRTLFVAHCGRCHTLAAAGASGTIGPSLDAIPPAKALVIERVTRGTALMPSFKDALTAAQIEELAAFVAASAG